MNASQLHDAIGLLDSSILESADTLRRMRKRRNYRLLIGTATAACICILTLAVLLHPHFEINRGNKGDENYYADMDNAIVGNDGAATEGSIDNANGTFIYAAIKLKIVEITDFGFIATVERDFPGADFYKGHVLNVNVDQNTVRDCIELKAGDTVYVGFSFDGVNSITAKKISDTDWSE